MISALAEKSMEEDHEKIKPALALRPALCYPFERLQRILSSEYDDVLRL